MASRSDCAACPWAVRPASAPKASASPEHCGGTNDGSGARRNSSRLAHRRLGSDFVVRNQAERRHRISPRRGCRRQAHLFCGRACLRTTRSPESGSIPQRGLEESVGGRKRRGLERLFRVFRHIFGRSRAPVGNSPHRRRLVPELVGTNQVRHYRFEDSRLTLDADTAWGRVRIIWERSGL